jgi:hypothetical protein
MTSKRRIFFGVVVATLALALSGCLHIEPPARFLVVEREPSSLKAITPEESRLWVRDFPDESKGGLPFWRDTLRADFEKNRGYTLISEATIVDGDGREGLLLTWEATLGGEAWRELMAVFVIPGWFENTIRVVEYVAQTEAFDAEVDEVKKAIGTLR